jgi:hypothetical protein
MRRLRAENPAFLRKRAGLPPFAPFMSGVNESFQLKQFATRDCE